MPLALTWPPCSGSRGQALECEKARSAHFPTASCGVLTGPFECLILLRTFRAVPSQTAQVNFELKFCFTIVGLPSLTSGTAFQAATV